MFFRYRLIFLSFLSILSLSLIFGLPVYGNDSHHSYFWCMMDADTIHTKDYQSAKDWYDAELAKHSKPDSVLDEAYLKLCQKADERFDVSKQRCADIYN